MTVHKLQIKDKRGIKRQCQNEECGLAFYDLNKESFACPHCAAEFDLDAENRALAAGSTGTAVWPATRRSPVYKLVAPEPAPTSDDDDGEELDEASDGNDVLELDDESAEDTDIGVKVEKDDPERGAA